MVRSSSFVFAAVGIAVTVACSGASVPPKSQGSFAKSEREAPRDEEPSCFDGQVERHDTPTACGGACTAHAIEIRRCVGGRWNVERVAADCTACPSRLPATLAGCELEHVTLKPTELGALDQCELRLHCGNTLVQTDCDGENDGTSTSLCECARNGTRDEHVLKAAYAGEAPNSCLSAAIDCRSPRPHSPKLDD